MLATNFPDEDHVHQTIKPVDLNNLPTKRDPNLIRRYACEQRRDNVPARRIER